MNKNKRGKISCHMEYLEDMFTQGINIFEKCLIVRAEHNYMDNTMEYHFYNDELEEVAPMFVTPKYTCKVTKDIDGIPSYVFVKQE